MYIETKKQHVRVSKLYFDISAFVYSFKSDFDLTYLQTHRINKQNAAYTCKTH